MPLLSAEQVRLWNLRYLASEHGGLTNLAKRLGRPQPMLSAYIGKRPIKQLGREFCAFTEQTLNLEPLWMDQPHPDRWAKIKNPDWHREIMREITASAVPIEEPTGSLGKLCSIAKRLPAEDQSRLLDFAQVLDR